MSFETALQEVASADADLSDVVRILLGMATFADLIGRTGERDHAVRLAAELVSARARAPRRTPS